MLRELLRRDLLLHRRMLLAASLIPLAFVAFAAWPSDALARTADPSGLLWIFGLLLLALLPLALQAREGMLRTLGDLLSLPIQRRDLVRLRFAEGLLGCGVFSPFFAAAWVLSHSSVLHDLGGFLRSSAPLWILLLCMAYPLPFYLRWRGKGVAAAYGLLGLGFYLLFLRGLRPGYMPPGFRLFDSLHHLHETGGILAAAFVDYGIPLLLLTACYGLALWAAERMEV